MNEKLHIVYSSDDGYLMPTLVAVSSALEHASERMELRIVILDVGIESSRWVWFEETLRSRYGRMVDLMRYEVSPAQYLKLRAYKGSVGAYARLDIPRILPDVDWCVYCDGDTLFLDDPLKLRKVFDDRFAIQGQRESENWEYDEKGVSNKQKWFESRGLGWNADQYVCSGFLLMNLNWFRANCGTERCMEFLFQHQDEECFDQEALSFVCRGYVGYLPDEWGRLSRNAFRRPRPCCIHYAADAPWKLMSSRRIDYNDAHKLWFDFARIHLCFPMCKLLTEPFRYSVFLRKYFFRVAFKLTYPLFCSMGFHSSIGRYLNRHYTTSVEYGSYLRGNA